MGDEEQDLVDVIESNRRSIGVYLAEHGKPHAVDPSFAALRVIELVADSQVSLARLLATLLDRVPPPGFPRVTKERE